MNNTVTIIIPNYNGIKFLASCLDSLKDQTYMNFSIIVVDNASTDGSIELLKESYPEAEIIINDKNYGFSTAVNQGIKAATTPYVILLNNDTTVDNRYVEEMVNAIESDNRIFSVSSKMLQMHHPELIDSAGDLYTAIGWPICRGVGRSSANYQKVSKIFSACAGAAIYRRSVFDEIGYFDENHFAYMEDIDIGYRALIYGYKNIYCPTAIVYHVGSGTSGALYSDFKVKLTARNSVYVNYKNMPTPQRIINAPALCLGYKVRYNFFKKRGFGDIYKEGLNEGRMTCKAQKKVPYDIRHFFNYFYIQLMLIKNLFAYAYETFLRKILKK